MKNWIYVFLFCSLNISWAQNNKDLQLQEVLKITKEVIEEIKLMTESTLLRGGDMVNYQPSSLVFSFETANSKSVGGGIRILIFSIGSRWSKSVTNNATYTYSIPKLTQKTLLQGVSLKHELSKTIINALQEIRSLPEEDRGRIGNFSTRVTFSIKKSASGSGSFVFVPLTFNADIDWNKQAVHSVTVNYEKK